MEINYETQRDHIFKVLLGDRKKNNFMLWAGEAREALLLYHKVLPNRYAKIFLLFNCSEI